MKNYPLSIQIWIIFTIITLIITLALTFILPRTLRDFFTKEIYSTIDSAQNIILHRFTVDDYWYEDYMNRDSSSLEDIRSVKHLIVYGDNQVLLDSPITIEFLEQIKKSMSTQNKDREYYKGNLDGDNVLYVISKENRLGGNIYLVSYMKDAYRQDLVKTLFNKLISIMGITFLLSWIPALFLSRYLSRPLVNLETKVERLAKHDWHENIDLDRKDEIGRLGDSIEELRTELIRQDELERSFLQNISHELKTPVMVIRSFSQAIKDGIFPKGNLENSIEVIDSEAKRLDKKIHDLLYFSKLDYMSNHGTMEDNFSLDALIQEVLDRLSWSRTDIDWDIDLTPLKIQGDRDQWKVVLENIIDNQMRYANTKISISLTTTDHKRILSIWNDGPHINSETMKNLFREYNKGYKGEFGLGLAIVSRILQIHNSTIRAINENIGVRFEIEI
ncbi:MAG: HAMP domain-containing sensor histidine kinase [Tissierellaceae bacterium]